MEAVPSSVDINAIEIQLKEIEGVDEVDELHIWALNNEKMILTAHVKSAIPDETMKRINKFVEKKHFHKSTIQMEKTML